VDNLVSIPEAARMLGGISEWTVRAWLSQGRLTRTKVGRRTMLKEEELKKVIREGEKSPPPNCRSGLNQQSRNELGHGNTVPVGHKTNKR
jgi:excisionase family DNA binding protein